MSCRFHALVKTASTFWMARASSLSDRSGAVPATGTEKSDTEKQISTNTRMLIAPSTDEIMREKSVHCVAPNAAPQLRRAISIQAAFRFLATFSYGSYLPISENLMFRMGYSFQSL